MLPAPPLVSWAALAWIVRDWMLVASAVLITFACVTCFRKKKPIEDLMAKPKFNKPVTVTPKQKTMSKQPIEKPVVEHTVSIKLDNNADEDDLKGPRESMSKDPMTDIPVLAPRNKGVNEFKDEHDKETNTPPSRNDRNRIRSKSKEEVPATKRSANEMEKSSVRKRKKQRPIGSKKLGKTMEESSMSRKKKTKPKQIPSTTQDEKPKKPTNTTVCEGNLDATQECAASAEHVEELISAKDATTMSHVSTKKRPPSSKAKKKNAPTPTKDLEPTQEDHATTVTKASAE